MTSAREQVLIKRHIHEDFVCKVDPAALASPGHVFIQIAWA